jgi:hypothetical protein
VRQAPQLLPCGPLRSAAAACPAAPAPRPALLPHDPDAARRPLEDQAAAPPAVQVPAARAAHQGLRPAPPHQAGPAYLPQR